MSDSSHMGRTILTILYLCMLAVCFVVPIFFYLRMHCDNRNNQRLRELEIAGMTQAIRESQDVHREESRAALRKYREERRARIIQLFRPVRMILSAENFVSKERKIPLSSKHRKSQEELGSSDEQITSEKRTNESPDDIELGPCSTDSQDQNQVSLKDDATIASGVICSDEYDESGEEEYVLIPKPGLPDGASVNEFSHSNMAINVPGSNQGTKQCRHKISEMRKVPTECSICLCEYEVGSEVVWSSNSQCDHVFHVKCIEEWLMKQRDGPLCPCCRRDFVIDPFDNGESDTSDIEKGETAPGSSHRGSLNGQRHQSDANRLELPPLGDSVEDAMVRMLLAASLAESMARIDVSDRSSINL